MTINLARCLTSIIKYLVSKYNTSLRNTSVLNQILTIFLFLENFESHLSKFSFGNSQSKFHIMYGFTIYF